MEQQPQYFTFKSEWMRFAQTITTIEERFNFYDSVANYGLLADEPIGLNTRALDYFNDVVRPDIDRQKGKRRRRRTPKQTTNND